MLHARQGGKHMNKCYFITMFFILHVSLSSQAQTNNIPKPAEPVYETCGQIAVPTENGGTIMETDYACLQRNSSKRRQYDAALDSYNRSLRLSNADSTDLVKPAEPRYEQCPPQDPENYYYSPCEQRNDALRRDYQFQLDVYNKAKAAQEGGGQNNSMASVQNTSALASANQAQNKNDDSKKIYELAAMGCTIAAAYYFTVWASTTCCCPPYPAPFTCPAPFKEMVMYSAFAGMAQSQAQSNANVAYQSCLVASQISSGARNCTPPGGFDPGQGLNSLFDVNGRCVGNQADCNVILGKLPPGTNIKDAMKGLSTFASSKKAIKTDKDGNLVDSNGKKYSPANMTEADLKALGLNPAAAKSLMADLKKNAAEAIAAANKSLATKTQPAKPNLGVGGANGASMSAAATNAANGKIGQEKDLDKQRDIASAEGLVRDFNGEQIGVAGDDIFKMMSRRYLLKDSQDSFVAP